MSCATTPIFKPSSMVNSCLISPPTIFTKKTTYPFLSIPSRPIRLRVACSHSSSLPSSFSLINKTRFPNLVTKAGFGSKEAKPGKKEQKWTHEGLITESLPNGMFRVRLDNEDVILGYISGKIRKSFIRILPGDRVKVEVSRYDSTKGRIIYRNKNPKD
ncbi:translation initiation factor IF-1, chloroplastic [Cornus florida]|uniref:translation initiation factor IF-1, chloroplastic n=1 Tax=Cornus florida TaxID=4283 RepID=UPI00289826DC|nr:translation initiation factor IF-1, chloroplastic [Cornus florida]